MRERAVGRMLRAGQRGFSMLEMITTILIVGTLATLAISNMDTRPLDAAGQAQALRNTLRFAQVLAMGDSSNVPAVWNVAVAANSYTLQRNCAPQDPARQVNIPGADDDTQDTGSAGNIFSNANVVFNDRGQPSNCAGVASNVDITITVTDAPDIVILRDTGFIE